MTDQYRKNVRMVDVLQHLLNRGLQSWAAQGASFDREALEGMYEYVLKSINELFSASSQNLTDETRRWVAQQFYLSILIKKQGSLELPDGSHLISVYPVFEPANIARIPTDELRLIGGLFSDCDFAPEIAKELKTRTWSR
jgi:hypothetical protein